MVGARCQGDHDSEIEETVGCHRIATREIVSEENSTGKFIPLKSCKEIMAPSAIKKMFEQDLSEPQDANLAMSQEDMKFITHVQYCRIESIRQNNVLFVVDRKNSI